MVHRDDRSSGDQYLIPLPVFTIFILPRALFLLEVDQLNQQIRAPITWLLRARDIGLSIRFERARCGLEIIVIRGRAHTGVGVEIVVILHPTPRGDHARVGLIGLFGKYQALESSECHRPVALGSSRSAAPRLVDKASVISCPRALKLIAVFFRIVLTPLNEDLCLRPDITLRVVVSPLEGL